jgi:hypothetical protein
VAGRKVQTWRDGDGTSSLSVRGIPTPRVEQAYGRVTAIAHQWKTRGDGRTIDQLRADVSR